MQCPTVRSTEARCESFEQNLPVEIKWKIFNRNPTIINKRMDNHQNPFTPVIAPCIGRYGVVVNLAPCVTTIMASKNVDSVITFVHSGAMPVFFLLIDRCFSFGIIITKSSHYHISISDKLPVDISGETSHGLPGAPILCDSLNVVSGSWIVVTSDCIPAHVFF